MVRLARVPHTRSLLLALSAPSLLAACGAADSPIELPGVVSPGEDDIGQVRSALDDPNSIDKVCGIIQSVASFLLNGTPFGQTSLNCSEVKVSNTYFNGSEPLAGNLSDLNILPFVQQGAYFCGIADADGAHVDGTLSGFGGFGLQSDFNVLDRDPPHARVRGRRTGTLLLFGVPGKLEAQDMDFTFPVEKTPSGSYGEYMQLNADGIKWHFGGTVTFPIGNVLVSLTPSIDSRAPTRTMSNGGLSFNPNTPSNSGENTNRLDPAYFFSNWASCAFPNCPNTRVGPNTFRAEHQVACPASITSLTDGVLPYVGALSPYGGAGCATQNFITFDTLANWFHFGRTAGSVVTNVQGPVEPSHNITSTATATLGDLAQLETNATTWASLEISANYSVGIANITLDTITSLAARDGFAVRQVDPQPLDGGSTRSVNFTTALNAQTKAGMHIKVSLDISGLLPPIDVSFDIDLGDTKNREFLVNSTPSPTTKIQYLDPDHTTFNHYEVKGVAKTNPDQARLQCSLATTTTAALAPKVSPPGPYFKDVATASLDQIHPCHVKTCHADGSNPVDFEWDPTVHNLVQKIPASCTICNTVEMDVCDKAGNPVNQTKIMQGQHITSVPGCVR